MSPHAGADSNDVRARAAIPPDAKAFSAALMSPNAISQGVVPPDYGADVWPMHHLDHDDAAGGYVLTWHRFPEVFRETMRAAAWHMLNRVVEVPDVSERGSTPSPRWSHQILLKWRLFGEWLQREHPHVERLSDVTRGHFEDWAAEGEVLASEEGRRGRLVPLSYLWAYSLALPADHQLPEPPWTRRRMKHYLGEVPTRGENAVVPIPAATMGPLLMTALAYVDGHLAERADAGTTMLIPKSAVVGACLVVVAYLTGMRPNELLNLKRGCAVVSEGPDGLKQYEVHGLASKGVERDQPWITIEPAHRALAVLDELAADVGEEVLFGRLKPPSTPDTRLGRAITTPKASTRIESFIKHANRHGRVVGSASIDPDQPLRLGRFRRTLAWHIVRQPGGEIALGVQYGHLRVVTGQGYAGRAEAGLLDVIELEEVALALDTIDEIAALLASGEVISGPAAATVRERVRKADLTFAGVKRSDKDLRRLRDSPHIQIYDVPNTLVVCAFQTSTAACLKGEKADERRTPAVDRCVQWCANAARTPAHVNGLRLLISEAQTERELAPKPLAERIDRRISMWRTAVDEHKQAVLEARGDVNVD